jgi:hypothetical protein
MQPFGLRLGATNTGNSATMQGGLGDKTCKLADNLTPVFWLSHSISKKQFAFLLGWTFITTYIEADFNEV